MKCIHCGEKIRERTREPGTYEHAKTRATWCYNSTVATPPPPPTHTGPIASGPVAVGVIVPWMPGHPIQDGWAFLDGTVRLEDHPALAEALADAYDKPWDRLPVIPGHAIRVKP